MRKVLLIGYPFPLRQGGSPRLLGLAKYLPEFGWQPIILTAPLAQKADPCQPYRIVETGYRNALGFWISLFRLNPGEDLRRQVKQRFGVTNTKSVLDRLLTFTGEIVNYPDSEKGWKSFAVKTGAEIIRQEGIDAIISTSAPVTTHIIGKELKSRYKIPWIADLRDLWSQNHNYSYSRLRKWFDRRLELRTLSAADALVTVSQPWADKLRELHKRKSAFCITNAFDPETVNEPSVKLTSRFTITYTGLIYPGKQDTKALLAALSDLISSGIIEPADLEVRFYGTSEGWLDREIEQYGLTNIARQYGSVTRDAALQKQCESQLLLLLNWNDPQEKGNFPGKIFEYLAARRPILATGGSEDDVVAGLLIETQAGIHAPTAEKIRAALESMYQEYKSQGGVAYSGDKAKMNEYSQREMARKFAEILDGLALGKETNQ